jgi:hypothetical protein
VKHELERVAIPGEVEAYGRTWATLEAAFAERKPVPRASHWSAGHWPRVAAIAVALAALLASAFSPPGQAVIDEIREAVGVEGAQEALFSVPAPGRLLVASDSGVWVVQQDGSRRLLRGYREATWSPFGRFVAAAGDNELVALEPDGDVRWTLARPAVRFPRWTGTLNDTRIVYLSGRRPRVVAGDGTGDRRLCVATARAIAPAWAPDPDFVASLPAPNGAVQLYEVDGCTRRWTSAPIRGASRIEWSADGTRLLVVGRDGVRLLRASDGGLVETERATVASFRPGTRRLVTLLRRRAELSELVVGGRVLFRGTGEFRDLAWSPDGKWALVTWPTADQWVFVRATGPRRLVAVSDVTRQFGGGAFPRIEGWCCTP